MVRREYLIEWRDVNGYTRVSRFDGYSVDDACAELRAEFAGSVRTILYVRLA